MSKLTRRYDAIEEQMENGGRRSAMMAQSKAGTITDHAAAFEWATVLTQSTVSASATRNLARAYIEQTKNIAALERSLAKLTAIESAEAVPVGWVCEDGTPALKGSRPLEPGTNLYAHPVPIAPGFVSVRKDVVDFLCGRGSLDGVRFGEKPTDKDGPYWWRKYLWSAK